MALDNVKLSQITEVTTSSSEDEFHRVNGNSRRIKRRNLGGASLAYFVNLLPGDSGDPELERVANAVNDNGVTGYARTKGEDMYFYTYQQVRTDNSNIEERFYKVKITDDNIGGSAGVQLTDADLQPSGVRVINLTDEPSLEIALEDIGSDTIEDGFNTDANEPFVISGLTFVTATQNDVDKGWLWVGGDGTFGNSGTPAVAGDFNLLGVSEIPIDETVPVEGSGGFVPSNFIKLDNWEGREYFMSAPSAITTYVTTLESLKGKARVLINAATEPVITGATKVNGDTFQANTDMYMHVEYNGVRVEYYFKSIDIITSDTRVLNVKVPLTASQIKTLNTIPVDLIAASGAGTYIQIESVVLKYNYGTTPFTSTHGIQIKTDGLTNSQSNTSTGIIGGSVDFYGTITVFDTGTTSNIAENTKIVATFISDSVLSGDGDVILDIDYIIKNVS